MKKAIINCVLLIIWLHLIARGLEYFNIVAHFFLITLLGTTLILPIGSFFILEKGCKIDTVWSIILKAIILLLVVFLSFLLDSNFNEHTDQLGRELGKLSLGTGIIVVCIIMAIRVFTWSKWKQLKEK